MDTLTTATLHNHARTISEYARLLDNCETENSPQANAIKTRYQAELTNAITAITAVKNNHTQVQASYTTVLAGANNDLVFTAVPLGTLGNGISVTYVDPGGATATLGVVVSGRDITVNLGRAASAINTTGTLLAAAIAAAPAAAALVTVANSGADTGAGLVIALSKQSLSGGKN